MLVSTFSKDAKEKNERKEKTPQQTGAWRKFALQLKELSLPDKLKKNR